MGWLQVDDETGCTSFMASIIDGTAFVWMVGVDLSGYQDGLHFITLHDSGGKKAWSPISRTAPGGETLAAAKTITGITKANPGVVTFVAGHGFTNGELIKWSGLTEMTELNNAYRTLAGKSGDTFQIGDTSAFTAAETTGGACAQQVTVPAATGALIVDSLGGSTRNFQYIESGFDPNAISSFEVEKWISRSRTWTSSLKIRGKT